MRRGLLLYGSRENILLLCIIEEGFGVYIFVTLKTLFYEIFAKMLSFLDFSS